MRTSKESSVNSSKKRQAKQELMIAVGFILLGLGFIAIYIWVDYPQKKYVAGFLPTLANICCFGIGIRSIYHYVLVRQEEKNKTIT